MLKRGVELASRFILLRPLAEGALSKVWLAEDREAGALVALKVLADAVADSLAIEGLQRESRLARGAQHPNILRVGEVCRSANFAWMVMEYADGGNLSQLRGRRWTEILRATLPIAHALGHVHRAGIVHRDVKTANVLIMSDGSPRLSDFGIALRLGEVPDGSVGRGSPFSMSPQQHDGSAATIADDIYGFGALLYELCCGQPPFYPHFSPERLRSAQPDPMVLREPLSKSIVSLVERCLEKRAIDRPQNMEVLAQELVAGSLELSAETSNESFLNPVMQPRIEPPKVNAPQAQGEPLRGEWRRSTDDGPTDSDLRRQGFRRGLTAAAGVLGVAGVFAVVFLLPKWVQSTADSKQASKPIPQPAKVEVAAPAQPKPLDFAALARAKQEAEEVRGPLEERLRKLGEQGAEGAEGWAKESFADAKEELAVGDKDFEAREYVLAMEHFNALVPLLTEMESRAGEVLKEQLAEGTKAIQEGRSADATKAFTLAANIDLKNTVATQGLKRAQTLDEVLSLVSSAERLESDGNLEAARAAYQKALSLDGQAPRAAEAIARIQSQFANDAFATAMARGFGALTKGDYTAARTGFEAARKIRPGATEIGQALRQVEQEERTRVISGKLVTARAFEGKERWADASQEYRAILQLDPTVAAAAESSARVQPRADLNAQLDVYIKQPERLFNASVRTGARDTLAQAGRIPNPGPVLAQQMASLRDWLARAEVPVAVALRSDNQTQVTIFRVGQLGAFEQRSLELAPGSYTVVGTRAGYRDVRREINVVPGAAIPPVEIRCEDKI
jgi:serine/threonine protein kinase/tetratricopeptide (TPR) repeat protein